MPRPLTCRQRLRLGGLHAKPPFIRSFLIGVHSGLFTPSAPPPQTSGNKLSGHALGLLIMTVALFPCLPRDNAVAFLASSNYVGVGAGV
jgi:hypothetical protein